MVLRDWDLDRLIGTTECFIRAGYRVIRVGPWWRLYVYEVESDPRGPPPTGGGMEQEGPLCSKTKSNEIEVTPEMIEAAVDAVRWFDIGESNPHRIVMAVLEAIGVAGKTPGGINTEVNPIT